MSKLVLIADDEFGLAEVLAQLLSDRGHEALLAVNGAAALARMAERRPDLVLLDVMMLMLDGPGLLRLMRDDPRLADVPVVLMTARPDQLAPEIRAIVQGLLVKPFTPDALMATVDALLR